MLHRLATLEDVPALGVLNHQLIKDEGHRNPMSVAALIERISGWIDDDYSASILEIDSEIVAYALYRASPDELHLRQFFVEQKKRRTGIGRQCMEVLLTEVWPRDKRITVDVLSSNSAAILFWRDIGFSDYCLTRR
jgi:GNAT superfamily N-acetyltransferase